MKQQESRVPAMSARTRLRGGVAIALIATAALLYWSIESDNPPPALAPGREAVLPERKAGPEKNDPRAAARGLAHIDLGKLKSRQERIQRIRQDIESADDPDLVFKELADLIASEDRPIERSVLVGDIFNEMFRFDSAAQGLEWIRRYQGYLAGNFKNLASGHDGTLSTENGYTVLKNAAGSFLMKIRTAGQGDELLDLYLKTPETEILTNELTLDIFSMCAMQSGTFKIGESELPDQTTPSSKTPGTRSSRR